MSLKKIGVVLWLLVLMYGGFHIYQKIKTSNSIIDNEFAAIRAADHDGRAFVETPWVRLSNVKPFVLTERSGEKFDSRVLAGKPYIVSFFYTSCSTICRDLNRQIGVLVNRYKDSDLTFISLSVKTKVDTPEVLRAYAEEFNADPESWLMLTGQQFKINAIASQQLNTVVDGEHHTGDIFLIDRWGRYRDRFSWDDPREMKRFDEVVDEVLEETGPPIGKTIRTRNVMVSLPHEQRNRTSAPVSWLLDFQLTDQHNNDFYSRDLTGTVWVASMFFTRCGTVCPRQNAFLSKLQPEINGRKARLVSITTDPDFDRPAVLRTYAKNLSASDDWLFLTGDNNYIQRVGSEFLEVSAHGKHHSSLLTVVDRWGNVRANLDWQKEGTRQTLFDLIDKLNQEKVPVASFKIIRSDEIQDD